eukprot:EG_transcript_41490
MNPKKRVAWRLEGYNTTIYPCTLAGDWYLCNFTLSPNFNFTNTSTAFRVIFTPLSDRLGLINTDYHVRADGFMSLSGQLNLTIWGRFDVSTVASPGRYIAPGTPVVVNVTVTATSPTPGQERLALRDDMISGAYWQLDA